MRNKAAVVVILDRLIQSRHNLHKGAWVPKRKDVYRRYKHCTFIIILPTPYAGNQPFQQVLPQFVLQDPKAQNPHPCPQQSFLSDDSNDLTWRVPRTLHEQHREERNLGYTPATRKWITLKKEIGINRGTSCPLNNMYVRICSISTHHTAPLIFLPRPP